MMTVRGVSVCFHTVSNEQMLILNNSTNGTVIPDKLRETVACQRQ